MPGDENYEDNATLLFDGVLNEPEGVEAGFDPFGAIPTFRAQIWDDYFLGIGEFDKKRVFGDMVVLSVKDKENFMGFSFYGIPVMHQLILIQTKKFILFIGQ